MRLKSPLQAIVGALLIGFIALPATAQERPKVGVAFGGGSARGIAHVGVIRWFEEHHIPIDVAAGTSMGGLIGGSFASGMTAADIQRMLREINWDEMFGFSNFAFKNIRRKGDARDYPSHLEFGLKKGIAGPSALNNGQQVDLLITRITAPYYGAPTFDALPTPFRVVAVDLKTAQPVIMDRGSLAAALRATMSLPGVFPPVEVDGKVLVDGGAMNNIPADVVRAMGGQIVVAVNVGDLDDQEAIKYSVFGIMGASLDAMMRANTKRALAAADIVLNVPVKSYGSLAWRRTDELIDAGYNATQAISGQLLPYALPEVEWQAWVARRAAARKTALATPSFVRVIGVKSGDERRMSEVFNAHVGKPLDVALLEHELKELSGLDRYETIGWQLTTNASGETGLTLRATEKQNAPPFLMLGVNLENTTSDDFRLSVAARYLRFDVLGSGTELRLDASVGSDPSIGVALYYPVWRSTFVVPSAAVSTRTYNLIQDDTVVARYGETVSGAALDVGVNLGRDSDVRLGAIVGRVDANATVGDPRLPAATGKQTTTHLTWRMNTQDRLVQPTHGVAAQTSLAYTIDAPDVTTSAAAGRLRSSVQLPQLSGEASVFRSLGGKNRLSFLGGGGTSFSHHPLAIDQFQLGTPLHLSAYGVGEVRGDHYWLATVGMSREIGRMPDFLGGPVHVGVWLENGDAFDSWSDLSWRTHVSTGLIVDTLIGPMLLGGSAGFDGRWRTYIGIGRLIR